MDTPKYWVRADLSTAEKIREFERTPLADRELPTSTYEFLARACRQNPEGIAIRYLTDPTATQMPRGVTFQHLLNRIHQTANLVCAEGLRHGDVVSLLLPNTPEAQYALWGTQAVAIANPINWMLEAEGIATIVNAASSTMLMAYGGDEHVEIWEKVLRVVELCPRIQTVVRLGGDRSGKIVESCRFLDFDLVIDNYPDDALNFERTFKPDDVAALFPTGGTTGSPKLVFHSHANEVISAWLSAAVAGIEEGDSRLSATPLYHVVGAFAGSLATLARGGTLVLATSVGWKHPQLLANIWNVVQTCQVNYLTIVPTVLNQLVKLPINEFDISSIKGVLSGSAPLSETVATKFLALTGMPVREGAGLTETTSVCMMNPAGGVVKTGSVGLMFPYHRARVIDPGSGDDVAIGTQGVIALFGPTVTRGYAAGGKANFFGVGWLDTGDLGKIDQDGYVWITGRSKDLIIRSGHNIDPRSVEEVFYRHPKVLEAAVVARPDSYAGEVPVAYVQLIAGETMDGSTLLQEISPDVTERAAIPKDCYILDSLPKSPVGKILKHHLRDDAMLRGFEKALASAGISGGFSLKVVDSTLVITISNSLLTEPRIREALSTFTTAFVIKTARTAVV